MTVIEALAQRCGVATSLRDSRGERAVPRATLETVLGALGVAAHSDARAAESLAELDREKWRAALPPAVVARQDQAVVELRLPSATRLVSWHVQCDDGSTYSGNAAFSSLPLVERDDADRGRRECRRLSLGQLPLGYHRLTIEPQDVSADLVVTPAQCYVPSVDEGQGLWGIALQSYLLRSERNFGIGDFGDLAAFAADAAARGCDVLGLNPLHAGFPDDAEHASPYSPASRLLLSPLAIDVAGAPEVRASASASSLLDEPAFAADVAACRAADIVEYRRVAAAKARVLDRAFVDWRAAGEGHAELAEFRAARGPSFERHCCYFALRAHVLASGTGSGDWHGWPEHFKNADSAEVASFARTHEEAVTRVAWEQWLADRQLAAAARAAGNMRVGLYRDLAVGCDAAGAETWAARDLMLEELRIGAPPDELSATGQEWGLPAPNPRAMRADGYRAFAELLRANMRHAGALRIDHVMALERLYVIPKGASPVEGTYLSYPFEDLAGIVALESARQRCVVIGEDLGTVPHGFRDRMAAANILSYRVLRFEKDDRRFFGPQEYPRLAVAVCSNHDLPTLSAWWESADLELEHRHGVLSDHDLAAARGRRDAERRALLDLLHREQLLPFWVEAPTYEELFGAVHALLGRTRALLVLAQLDDLTRERLPVNVPSTGKYPSWRRRYSQPVERLGSETLLGQVAAAFGAHRDRASAHNPS